MRKNYPAKGHLRLGPRLKNDVKIGGRKQASEGGKYRMKDNAQKKCIEIKMKYRRGWRVKQSKETVAL